MVSENDVVLTLSTILDRFPWRKLEDHLNAFPERIDKSIKKTHILRQQYRQELLKNTPTLRQKIKRPSPEKLEWAKQLLLTGTVAASDGTISTVPHLGGSKIQLGIVIVFNKGKVVDYVTNVMEPEITSGTESAIKYFQNLRKTRRISSLLSRALMMHEERNSILKYPADWRMIHGEILPYELRTGAGNPKHNLPLAFELVQQFLHNRNFIAVSETSDDIDILNAAILLEPGEYIYIKNLTDVLHLFLDGDKETGQSKANFSEVDARKFREFIQQFGNQVSIILAKAGNKPFLLECHSDQIEEAVSLFMVDSVWTRGLDLNQAILSIRGYPFHIDLADQVARNLLKASDFQNYVEARLFDFECEGGIFDIDPRKMRM